MRMLERYYDEIARRIDDAFLRSRIMPIEISHVAKWFYEEDNKDVYSFREDFPSVAPPWPVCWFEFRNPQFNKSTNTRVPKNSGYNGFLFLSTRLTEKEQETILENDPLFTYGRGIATKIEGYEKRRLALWTELDRGTRVKWIIVSQQWYGDDKRSLCEPVIDCAFYLDDMGRVLPEISNSWTTSKYENLLRLHGTGLTYLQPVFLALSLLHCKNVTMIDLTPPPPKVQKKRAKRGIPTLQYKTLVVEPMRKQVRRESEETGENEIKRALHICRGHFKDYREGGGLFGQLHDIYWWESHVRGDAKQGTIVKDYEVRMPKE